jgi:hypothetical protein
MPQMNQSTSEFDVAEPALLRSKSRQVPRKREGVVLSLDTDVRQADAKKRVGFQYKAKK